VIRKLLRRRRARKDVLLAAQLVESSHEPGLRFEYDPDDLEHLRRAVVELRSTQRSVRL